MSFSAYKDLGHLFKATGHIAFFGNRNATLDKLKAEFPDFAFKRLKQTHSDIFQQIKKADPEQGSEGDALWTQENRLALSINTADCMPILIHSKAQGRVAAVHAGWRGVQNQIALKVLKQVFTHPSPLDIYLGPHILFESFEVGEDVKKLLSPTGKFCRSGSEGKHFVDLVELVKGQIKESVGTSSVLKAHLVDTKKDPDYFSHRREPENKGRQISFIARL